MRAEQLSDVLGQLPEELLQETVTFRRRRRHRWLPMAAAAACLALTLGLGIWYHQEGKTPASPNPELPLLQLSPGTQGGFGAGGYFARTGEEGYVSGSPWREELALQTLPVYANAAVWDRDYQTADSDYGPACRLLRQVAEGLGLTLPDCRVTAIVPDGEAQAAVEAAWAGEGLPEELSFRIQQGPVSLLAETETVSVEVTSALSAFVHYETPLALPEGCGSDTLRQAQQTAQWALAQYAGLLDWEQPRSSVSSGEDGYEIVLYDGGGDVARQLAQHDIRRVRLHLEDGGLSWLEIFWPDLSRKVGDYPLLTVAQATELLEQGRYVPNWPIRGTEYIRQVELKYRATEMDAYFIPYYVFWVETEQDPNGFDLYYVPAVESCYLENMLQWDGHINGG